MEAAAAGAGDGGWVPREEHMVCFTLCPLPPDSPHLYDPQGSEVALLIRG